MKRPLKSMSPHYNAIASSNRPQAGPSQGRDEGIRGREMLLARSQKQPKLFPRQRAGFLLLLPFLFAGMQENLKGWVTVDMPVFQGRAEYRAERCQHAIDGISLLALCQHAVGERFYLFLSNGGEVFLYLGEHRLQEVGLCSHGRSVEKRKQDAGKRKQDGAELRPRSEQQGGEGLDRLGLRLFGSKGAT
jgi:hypothetical protein